MAWCSHCQDECTTVHDYDNGYTCCTGCGKVINQDVFADEPTFTKDSSGRSKLSGNLMRSTESSYSVSRERTLQKGRDEISEIVNSLEVKDGEITVEAAHKLYGMAVDKNFTRGRLISHVAAACIYIICRSKKWDNLLIDFSNHLSTSVYVLGAVFLQLCEKLSLVDSIEMVDPSLYIHRFTRCLLGEYDAAFEQTALYIVASMKRDWMQTGRKPSGLCGAAIYITALAHGLNYSKSDIVTVVHICEATLTKRLDEFENTDSASSTIEDFVKIADELAKKPVPSHLSRPGEVLCEHKNDQGISHFAHGLCKTCVEKLYIMSGGLEGGNEPPAFQRAEKQRIERAHELEKMNELSVEETEAGFPKIDSDSTRCKSLASKEQESPGHQVADTSACDGQQELENSANKDRESLSDIDDSEVDVYLHNDEETRYKQNIWELMNKEYLEEQAVKEAFAANGEAVMKPKKKRKQRTTEEANNSTPADTAREATRQMLKKKTFRSTRVNYEALKGLYTADKEKAKEQETGGGDQEIDEDEDYMHDELDFEEA